MSSFLTGLTSRFQVGEVSAADSPPDSSLVSVVVLDGPGRPVDELVHEIAREVSK